MFPSGLSPDSESVEDDWIVLCGGRVGGVVGSFEKRREEAGGCGWRSLLTVPPFALNFTLLI